MGVYLRTEFQISGIILTSLDRGDNFGPKLGGILAPLHKKKDPKKATQIMINMSRISKNSMI